jgi:hypothetical protein
MKWKIKSSLLQEAQRTAFSRYAVAGVPPSIRHGNDGFPVIQEPLT